MVDGGKEGGYPVKSGRLHEFKFKKMVKIHKNRYVFLSDRENE